MTPSRRPAHSARGLGLLAAGLAACCFVPGAEGVDGGSDAGRLAGDAGPQLDGGPDGGLRDAGPPDGGRDSGMVDSGPPSDGGPDGGTQDSGLPWEGFGGTCGTLVAPLSWSPDGDALCPLPCAARQLMSGRRHR
jgi:hypothetical protein